MAFTWSHSGSGKWRPTGSWTITSPAPKQAAPATTTQVTNPYGGFDPNTIDVAPFLEQQSAIQKMSLDPQQELRDREQQELQEQTRAQLATRGLNLSAQGAGIEGDVMKDFGIDWQDRQLGRATQGAQGMALLGNLQQNVASQGWQHQQDLGRSAFEYDPDTSMMGGGGGGGVTGGFYGGGGLSNVAGGSIFDRPSSFQQRRMEQQAQADAYNARARQQNQARQAATAALRQRDMSRYGQLVPNRAYTTNPFKYL